MTLTEVHESFQTKKKKIQDVIPTGIRAIDGTLTVVEGQRMALFASRALERVPCCHDGSLHLTTIM